MSKPSQRGFTLIEMMIVVVIIGVLASIAYPSYTEYVLRANRTEGMAMLSDAAARQERFFVQNHAYITSNGDLEKLRVPSSTSPGVTSTTGKYTLSVTSANGYTLKATPTQAQKDTKCGTLVLDAKGTRGIENGTGSATDCWR
jgi:type IV pilus assembly protein PilE